MQSVILWKKPTSYLRGVIYEEPLNGITDNCNVIALIFLIKTICNRIGFQSILQSKLLKSKSIVATKLIKTCPYLIKKFEIDHKRSKIYQKWLNLIEKVNINWLFDINWLFQSFNRLFQSFNWNFWSFNWK